MYEICKETKLSTTLVQKEKILATTARLYGWTFLFNLVRKLITEGARRKFHVNKGCGVRWRCCVNFSILSDNFNIFSVYFVMLWSKSSLLITMASKSEKINCDECGEEFPTVSSAIQHKFRKHRQSNVKHYCPYCGQQFPIKVQHILSLPWLLVNNSFCLSCWCQFCRDKHVLSHKNEGQGSGEHVCAECTVSFYNKSALQYHSKSIHNR